MSEFFKERRIFNLFEVTKSIQKALNDRYGSTYWIKAEMNKLNFYKHSGHCYPELVEKKDGKVIAQIRSHLWKKDFDRINLNFLKTLNEPLKDGIKILFEAKITFDSVHGLSIWILDIDPSFTLGDLEKEKQESIQRLKVEGLFDRNKKLQFPLLPQRIAVISVETSKGYADFLRVIDHNPFKYRFFHYLFPSLLQGDKAAHSIIKQLRRIESIKHHFDIVVIIRGGGGDIGLSCYNDYNLSKEIAEFPLPVLTGIGHATNETVSEMIAFANAITPTKLAEFLIQKFHDFANPVQKAQETISSRSKQFLLDENTRLNSEIKLFKSFTEKALMTNKNILNQFAISIRKDTFSNLDQQNFELNHIKKKIKDRTERMFLIQRNETRVLAEKLSSRAKLYLKTEVLELENIKKNIENMSPEKVLKRGYSITLLNGKAVKSIKELNNKDLLETLFLDGKVQSSIQSILKKNENE